GSYNHCTGSCSGPAACTPPVCNRSTPHHPRPPASAGNTAHSHRTGIPTPAGPSAPASCASRKPTLAAPWSALLAQSVGQPVQQLTQTERPIQLRPGILTTQHRNPQLIPRQQLRRLDDIHLPHDNAVTLQRTGQVQAFLAQMAGGGSKQGQHSHGNSENRRDSAHSTPERRPAEWLRALGSPAALSHTRLL